MLLIGISWIPAFAGMTGRVKGTTGLVKGMTGNASEF